MAIGNACDLRRVTGRTARVARVAALVAAVALTPSASDGEQLRCTESQDGEIEVDARGVPIGRVLEAIGAKSGFAVSLVPGQTRAPVNATVAMAPIEDVLREILRHRNYALVYDRAGALDAVIVLQPPGQHRVSRPPARRGAAGRRGKQPKGPVVVRR